MVASLVASHRATRRASPTPRRNVRPDTSKAESPIRVTALWVIDVISAIPFWVERMRQWRSQLLVAVQRWRHARAIRAHELGADQKNRNSYNVRVRCFI